MNRNSPSSWLPAAFAGLCATLIGLGIARFCYVPLLPLLIDAHWTSTSGAAQLAAANLVGYLIGAFTAHRLALRAGTSLTIRAALVAVLLSLLGCSINLGLGWLWFWRLVSGAAGGVLMIVSVPTLLSRIPYTARGKAIGLMFSGIGCGVMLTGFMVPALGAAQLEAAWLALAAVTALALLYAWPKFREPAAVAAPPAAQTRLMPRGALLALLCAYVLDAVGYLPHTVLWVEYLVHGLGHPLASAGAFWVVFGAGAAVGPVLSGYAADRFGFRKTLIACFALKAAGVALPLVSTSTPALFASSFVVGALTPSMGAIVSGRALEIAGAAEHQRNWAMLTFIYALLQAAGGYGMATLYAATHSFNMLFAIGAATLGLAAAIAAFGSQKHAAPSVAHPPRQ